MALQIVGAGLGRTGTSSLKIALERLLGEPCYHMREVFQRPEDLPIWESAALGEAVDWHALFADYAAAVDFPAGVFWRELSEVYPDALILLSLRDPQSWWQSASSTIFHPLMFDKVRRDFPSRQWHDMMAALLPARFTYEVQDREAALAAYERHYADVYANAPAERLLEWHPRDGWQPICERLGLPIPAEPFPHINTTEMWQARIAERRAQLEGE